MKYLLILFTIATQCSCTDSEPHLQITNEFTIFIDNDDPVTFYNPECDFNVQEKYQSQFNVTRSDGYFLLSTYWNSNSMDSILSQIWIELDFQSNYPNELNSIDSLTSILFNENSSNNNEQLKIAIMLQVNGKKYYNRFLGDLDDFMLFQIEEYELPYYSDCLKRNLLYLKLQFEGPFYSYDVATRTDSIRIKKSEIKLLFAAD